MDDSSGPKKHNVFFFLSWVFVITLFATACTDGKIQRAGSSEKNKHAASGVEPVWKLPISIHDGELNKVAGWLSDEQIVYITTLKQSSNIHLYNLVSGKNHILYHSDSPIVNVQISPSKKFLLIQSTPSAYQGLVTIVDLKGTELLKQSFPSYELAFEWNPFDESKILVTKFNQDWTFQMFLLDLQNKNAAEVSLPQPFIKWIGKDKIAFLNWNQNNPGLFAPLIVKNLTDQKDQTILPSVVHFTAFSNWLMTIDADGKDRSKAVYSFYDGNFRKIFSFSAPQLSNYSGWLIPFYDYNGNSGQFITFRPFESGEADTYAAGFELVSYDLKNRSSRLMMEGLKNEPLSLSPSGKLSLYGNRLEKLIDVKNKKIYQLFKE